MTTHYFNGLQAALEDLWSFVTNGFSYNRQLEKSSGVELVSGTTYAADSYQTLLIRSVLEGTVLQPALSNDELLLYRLQCSNDLLQQIQNHPTEPWHIVGKGHPVVHVSINPTSGSVMEYFANTELCDRVFVRGVNDDNSLVVETISDGVYEQQKVSHEIWQGLRPVFISCKDLAS